MGQSLKIKSIAPASIKNLESQVIMMRRGQMEGNGEVNPVGFTHIAKKLRKDMANEQVQAS